MKVLVCGGRDFTDQTFVNQTLDAIHQATPITKVIHGQCRGADMCANFWAWRKRIPVRGCPAAWVTVGQRIDFDAGCKRNQLMLEEHSPDLVVAFPGDGGTADMVQRATARGIPVKCFAPPTAG